MKAREHQRILRERLNALREYMLGEVTERDSVIDRYADTLDRQDAVIAILKRMLIEQGVDADVLEINIETELAKLNGEAHP